MKVKILAAIAVLSVSTARSQTRIYPLDGNADEIEGLITLSIAGLAEGQYCLEADLAGGRERRLFVKQ